MWTSHRWFCQVSNTFPLDSHFHIGRSVWRDPESHMNLPSELRIIIFVRRKTVFDPISYVFVSWWEFIVNQSLEEDLITNTSYSLEKMRKKQNLWRPSFEGWYDIVEKRNRTLNFYFMSKWILTLRKLEAIFCVWILKILAFFCLFLNFRTSRGKFR